MFKNRSSILLLTSLLLCGCGVSPSPVDPEVEELEIYNVTINGVMNGTKEVSIINPIEGETFSYSYSGDSIRIDENGVIYSYRGGTQTEVNVTSSLNRTGKFVVNVLNRTYNSTHKTAEESEGWFNEVNVNKVASMTSSFVNGIDISSMKQLYDNGARFYNKEGKETFLPLLLKDNGVNWARLRLWVEPYDTYVENGETKIFQYGGGNCDLEHVLWMAKECKLSGLKVLLNFHYSDFWTDPSNQIIPKAWKDISTVSELASTLKAYTKNTLLEFKNNNCLPDAVALGNEIYSGLFAHNPGTTVSTTPRGDAPYYQTDRSERTDGTQAKYDHSGNKNTQVNSNLRTYLKAANDAVKEVSSSIPTMVHYVRGFTDPNDSIKFFTMIDDLGIDIYALSAYVYYHFQNASTLKTGLTTIANAFPNKKICIAETSYGFTFEADEWARNTFTSDSSATCKPVSSYEPNIQGQANLIHDVSEIVSDLANGWGVFYWEGAWTPTKKSGWADAISRVSWANQALVSYNGKALGSLEVYKKMLGN